MLYIDVFIRFITLCQWYQKINTKILTTSIENNYHVQYVHNYIVLVGVFLTSGIQCSGCFFWGVFFLLYVHTNSCSKDLLPNIISSQEIVQCNFHVVYWCFYKIYYSLSVIPENQHQDSHNITDIIMNDKAIGNNFLFNK
jgi:hypothetical protein